MIQDKPFGNPMTQKETFDAFYTRKLEALKIELKAVIKGDIPYPVSATYACPTCQGRMFLHTMEGQIRCLLCQMPSIWPRELKTCVATILQSYPSYESAHVEWKALQKAPTHRESKGKARIRGGDVELGKKIRAARKALGLTQAELAHKIYKTNGGKLTHSAIQNYELAEAKPSAHVLEQLKIVLNMEVSQDVQ